MNKTIVLENNICTDFEGYKQLILLYDKIKNLQDVNIVLDFSIISWFEANLCAVLGAIMFLMEKRGVTFSFKGMSKKLQDILERNCFLKGYHYENRQKDTVVGFQKFRPEQDNEFNEYIIFELLSKPDFPKHSKLLGKKITESIFEIFENARTHGKCEYIHTCGQYYPRKSPARLDMTIVDIGHTFYKTVNDYFKDEKIKFKAEKAIEWALEYGNTTKTNITGGLGLALIIEFLKLNKGCMQIVSADGYCEIKGGNIRTRHFQSLFPGTIVNIEFNFDDSCFYKLKSEASLTPKNIF